MHLPYFHRDPPPNLLERLRRKRVRKYKLFFVFIFSLCSVLLFSIVVLFLFREYASDILTPERLLNRNFHGLIIYDSDNSIIYQSEGAHESEVTPISAIPLSLQHATVAIEDKDFNTHSGISVSAIMRSAFLNISSQQLTAYGASTITQQLVKNALLDDRSKSFERKFKEIILSVGVDQRYSKDEILSMYLNSIYYGRGAYGAREASQIYFNKPVDSLTTAESAFLAGLAQAPSLYGDDLSRGMARQKTVLERMYEQKYISADELADAQSYPLDFNKNNIGFAAKYPHFSLYVRDFVTAQFGAESIEKSGLRVFTSLNQTLQKRAEAAVASQVALLAKNGVSNAAAMVVSPSNGSILAMVGSSDWYNDSIDGKVNILFTLQQPGSSIKPFVYARALERKLLSDTSLLADQLTVFPGGYSPRNYDGKFHGNVTVRRALSNSFNIPAVLALQKIGVPDGVTFAKQMGISSLSEPSQYGLSFALGASDVTPFDMVRGYTTLARGGSRTEISGIEKIIDKYGKVVYSRPSDSQQVADAQAIATISDILADNSARQESFGNALTLTGGMRASVKTGTTDSYRDAWTLGYTKNLVVGVWVGNNDNTPMDKVAGSLGAAPIWKEIISGSK